MKKTIEQILNKRSKFVLDMSDFENIEQIKLHKQIKIDVDEIISVPMQSFTEHKITSIILNIDYKEDISLEIFSMIVDEVRKSVENPVDVTVGTTINEDTGKITVDIFYINGDDKYKDITMNWFG